MYLLLSNIPPEQASAIAETLVREDRAACVTLTPVTSVYEWEGELCHDQEVTLQAKVGKEGVAATRERILELHPYDLPEVLVLPVDTEQSHGPYVEWVRNNTK